MWPLDPEKHWLLCCRAKQISVAEGPAWGVTTEEEEEGGGVTASEKHFYIQFKVPLEGL